MDPFWYLVIPLVLWSALGAGFITRAFARGLVSVSRRWRRDAGLVGFGAQFLALTLFALVCSAGAGLATETGSDLWAFATSLPACLVYMPIALAAAPWRLGQFGEWREELEKAGANRSLADRTAKLGAPVAVFGFIGTMPVLYSLAERL